MKTETVTVNEPNDHKIFDLAGGDYGLVTISNPVNMEVWYDHRFDGSGVGNMTLEAFGRELDLEYCYSRELTAAEREEL